MPPECSEIEVRSPYSGELVESLPGADAADAQAAVERAHGSLSQPLPPHRRVEILERVSARLRESEAELARLLALEAGKPRRSALEEIRRAARTAKLSAIEAGRLGGELVPLEGSEQGQDHLAFTRRLPIGVVGAITPFNFPLNLVMHKVGPAVAAGCPVVLKPAEKTPLSALWLGRAFHDAGLPEDRLHVVVGEPAPIAEVLCRDPRVQLITFTGSARVGALLQERAPGKRVALELGNATPAIVAADADLDVVAARIVAGAFGFAGQACISIQRVYAEETVAAELGERIAAGAASLRCGDPLDPEVEVGPVISAEARDRVLALAEDARRLGARQLGGGHLEGNLVTPIVLDGAPAASRIENEEAFGPIVSLNPYSSPEEAIARANATEYGLQAAIFTNDLAAALRATEQLDFAGVLVNESPSFRADSMPYGGIKASGNTREGPAWAVREMTEERLVVVGLG